jgi:mercuric ion transport protein
VDTSQSIMSQTKLIATGFIGAIVAALCCATPVLVVMLGAVGLSAVARYVLFPAIVVFVALGIYGLLRQS